MVLIRAAAGIQLFCTELPGQTRCDIRRKTICRRQLDLTIRPALQKTNNFASALIYWLKTSVQVQQIKVARRQEQETMPLPSSRSCR
jgi:hypothetical protein